MNPPAPSTAIHEADIKALQSRSQALQQVGESWLEIVQTHKDENLSFLNLIQVLVDLKFQEQERDQILHDRVLASTTQVRDAIHSNMCEHYTPNPPPQLHPALQTLESTSLATFGHLQTQLSSHIQTELTRLTELQEVIQGITFEESSPADWEETCEHRDTARRNYVNLVQIMRAGQSEQARLVAQTSAGLQNNANAIQAAYDKVFASPKSQQIDVSSISNPNAGHAGQQVVQLHRQVQAAQNNPRRQRIQECAMCYIEDLQQRSQATATTEPTIPHSTTTKDGVFEQESMLHQQRLRLLQPINGMKHLVMQLKQEQQTYKKLDDTFQEAEALTPHEETEMEDKLDTMQTSIGALSRRLDGLQTVIRALCFDAISWQQRFHLQPNQPNQPSNPSNPSTQPLNDQPEGETKENPPPNRGHDLELSHAFPDVWQQCKNIRTVKKRKRRTRGGRSSSPHVDDRRMLNLLDKHDLLLVGRTSHDYNSDDLPPLMVAGTQHLVHVNGRRLRGIPNRNKSLVILKTIPATDYKRIRAALIYAHRLKHKYVVPVDGAFVDENNFIVVQTPFFAGGSLRQWCTTSKQGRDERSKVVVMSKVAEAAAFLHTKLLIHRDFKPGNIVMSSSKDNADPAVTDFDISKSVRDSELVTKSTRMNLGTERYMSPELTSHPPQAPTFKCDIYSLGVTFLELFLCDCDEFKLMKLVEESGMLASDELDWHRVASTAYKKIEQTALLQRCQAMKLIVSMVAKNPNDRPAASEVARVLRQVATGLGSYECISCYDSFELNAGVLCCGAAPHFLCRSSEEDCFNKHVTTLLEGMELNAFPCAFCPAVYSAKTLNTHMSEDNAKKLREKREEAAASKARGEEKVRFEQEKKREEAKNQLERETGRHRKHIEEQIMTLRCPRCRQAFESYNGCAALTCSNAQCGCGFCAICLEDCGGDAHTHCQQVHGSWSVSTPRWKELMRALKQKRLEKYWIGMKEEVKQELLKNDSVRSHFTDLNMLIPGEGQFAGQLAQLRGMGFEVDQLNLKVLRQAVGDVMVAVELLTAMQTL